ncbi:MAG: pyridoxamine 5'-phosphate oxidase family protein [Gammaproteobacteria bacterium]
MSATISDEKTLREFIGEPIELAVMKARPSLDKHSKEFIARSPFLSLGTSDASGKVDVSPRGDAPGFVLVLDDNTLFIPERPGNRRVDSLSNIVSNPNVGLLFMIPGFEDTLRVNGKASVVTDESLLEQCAVKGKAPKTGIRVDVEEAYIHCAKAFKRSKLWAPESLQDRSEMPSLAQMILEQVSPQDAPPSDGDIAAGDELVEGDYKENLY